MTINFGQIITNLYATIQQRRNHADPATSYVAKLTARGRKKICQKVGEEAVETVIAGVSNKPDKIISESADLLFHLLILWADSGVAPEQVAEELASREGISGIEEKAGRLIKPAGENQ